MADPISLAAIAGLVFAGRALSKTPVPVANTKVESEVVATPQPLFEQYEIQEQTEQNFEARVELPSKREMSSFADIAYQQRSGGQEILNMRNRMYDTGRMNNLSPIERQMVGPGLGVGAETPPLVVSNNCFV